MTESAFARSIAGTSFVLPVLNGVMHLPPAVSATHTVLGYDQPLQLPILIMLFGLHVLIDVLDKYADLPSNTRKAWGSSIAAFASPFVLLVGYGTWHCGFMALFRLLGVPFLAIIHGTPLIPVYSWRDGRIKRVKLKALLGPFKSIFGATCIALMDVTAVVRYLQSVAPQHPQSSDTGHAALLLCTVVYDFLWESIADVRDVEEDSHHGVTTLATTFGIPHTLMLVGISTVVGDLWITSSMEGSLTVSLGRSVFSWLILCTLAMFKPRRATYAWSLGSLVALLPVWSAHRSWQGN